MSQTYTRPQFVERYGPYISKATKGSGILPGTLIAQAIIESQGMVGSSYRVGGSTLSREANNYFGIKCHGWGGKGYNIDTREQTSSGVDYTEKGACFRSYDSVEDSIDDYIKFLHSNSNYRRAGVFQAKTVEEQAKALKRAGYATDVNYASTVTKVYNSVRSYVDKFSSYGIKGVWKSFRYDPKSFIKRNKVAFIGVGIILTSAGVLTYVLIKSKKK